MSNKKGRINIVYSTNPDYNYEYAQETTPETLSPEKQNLKVVLDTKQRAGKTVTLIQGFIGSEEDLKELAKLLKNKCGVGDRSRTDKSSSKALLKRKYWRFFTTITIVPDEREDIFVIELNPSSEEAAKHSYCG